MSEVQVEGAVEKKAHVWERSDNDWYVDPPWCSARLFDVEDFVGSVWDPACGLGTIVDVLRGRAMQGWGSDISGFADPARSIGVPRDFLGETLPIANIVSNPPFKLFRAFAEHALKLAERKVALIWLARTLPAARWLQETPLARVYFLTPRPSMPPASYVLAGKKAGGGTLDFCWLVWDKRHYGRPEMLWLKRDV